MASRVCVEDSGGDGMTPGRTWQPRAERFPIRTVLRYRSQGGTDWIESRSINISRTGILFYAPDVLDPKSVLEMQILFPTEITGGDPAHVVCWGPIVRTEPASAPETNSAAAAAILRYRFTHA